MFDSPESAGGYCGVKEGERCVFVSVIRLSSLDSAKTTYNTILIVREPQKQPLATTGQA
jgi:hypothetical protein